MQYSTGTSRCDLPRLTVFRLGCTLVSLGALASCARTVIDRSLLTSDPCGPPCWQGIVPGTSPAEDAAQVLAGSAFVAPDSLRRQELDGKLALLTWASSSGAEGINSMSFCNDRVWTVHLVLGYGLTAEEVIARFGEPEGMQIAGGSLPEDTSLSVFLNYPDLGIRLEAAVPIELGELLPTTEVVSVTYFDPEAVFQDLCPAPIQNGLPWRGYGDVEAKPTPME